MNTSKIWMSAAATAATALLAGCSSITGQSLGNPAAPPPLRLRVPAGPGWSAETAYLRAHPVAAPKGMQAGILVRSSSMDALDACGLGLGTWDGIVVIPGGWTESLSSSSGDYWMASLASPGDLIEFP